MACSSSCLTQNHATWGECVRSKNLHTVYLQEWKGLDYTKEKSWNKELDAYANAKAQGIQPDSTRMKDIEGAVRISNETGHGYDQMKLSRTDVRTLR